MTIIVQLYLSSPWPFHYQTKPDDDWVMPRPTKRKDGDPILSRRAVDDDYEDLQSFQPWHFVSDDTFAAMRLNYYMLKIVLLALLQ